MATPSKAKAAAKTPEPTVAMTVPDTNTEMVEYEDYGEDAGKGHENQDASDRKLPMFVILQANSPQVTQRQAQAGQIYNTVTKQAYDAIDFVPAITDHCFTEWIPRDPKTGAGGGFRGRHQKNAAAVGKAIANNGGRAFGKLPVKHVDKEGKPLVDKEGKALPDTELVETFEIASIMTQAYRLPLGLQYDPKNGPPMDQLVAVFPKIEPQTPGMIACTSTKIKAYREWNTDIGMFQTQVKSGDGTVRKQRVPLFAHHVRMITKLDSRGTNSFYVPAFVPVSGSISKSLLPKSGELYAAGRLLHEQHQKGIVTAAYETDTESNASGDGGPESSVPF